MLADLKRVILESAPPLIRRQWQQYKFRNERAMPLPELFSDIYQSRRWGSSEAPFYSGSGSDEVWSADFVEIVRRFIKSNGVRSVVDIGCGDFRVGRQIAECGVDYTGVDVVPGLIEHNQIHYGAPRVSFRCANAVVDEIPGADLCLIRQVLQHLSNAQISSILGKLDRYQFAIIAEAHPRKLAKPNLDKQAGTPTRVAFRSGVYVDQPPFALRGVEVLARTPHPELNEVITTCLVRCGPPAGAEGKDARTAREVAAVAL